MGKTSNGFFITSNFSTPRSEGAQKTFLQIDAIVNTSTANLKWAQAMTSWKLRANNADLENYWVCNITSNPQKDWSALSESGHFNSLEWRQQKMLSII